MLLYKLVNDGAVSPQRQLQCYCCRQYNLYLTIGPFEISYIIEEVLE